MELEKRKQDINALEKELIKAREANESKARDLISMQDNNAYHSDLQSKERVSSN
jgi:hypothetical protein